MLNTSQFSLLATIWFCLYSGCKPFEASDPEVILARVVDSELTLSRAQKELGGNFSHEDSAQVYAEYIDTWIREQSLLQKAKEVLDDSEKDKSDLITRYYNDLLIYELHEKLLQQRLDTTLADGLIEEYYIKNQQNFELKENILRLQFVKFQEPLPQIDSLWNTFVAANPDDWDGLTKLADISGGYSFSDDTTWLTFNDILKEIPIVTYNQENYLNNNKFIKLVAPGYTYFAHILEFKVKNNTSPLEFERERIKNILLNKRKVELLQLLENEIVEKAYQDQKIEIF